MKRSVVMACGIALLVGTAAFAQDEVDLTGTSVSGGQGWSVLTGETVGRGNTILQAQVGWPGVSLGLLHGVDPKVDLGARFTFNYGLEGMTDAAGIPELKLQGVVRLKLLDRGRVNLGVTFAPGPLLYFIPSSRVVAFDWAGRVVVQSGTATIAGLTIPVGLNLGIPVGSALALSFGLDIPMYVIFNGGGVAVPMLVGAGAEYFIDRRLAATFTTRMGPTITRYQTLFTLEMLVGIAYKL